MIRLNDLVEVLNVKVAKDMDDFQLYLIGCGSEELIELAPEIVDKTRISEILTDTKSLSAEQIMALLKLDDTVDACYEAWNATELGCPFKMENVIIEFADYLLSKSAQAD